MKLSDMQNKDIVSINDGRNIGNIIDININNDGFIDSLVIEPNKNVFKFLSKNQISEIKWNSIKKIGEDVILVDEEKSA